MDNLQTPLLRKIFSIWQSYHADGKELSLDDLINSSTISLTKHNTFLYDSNFLCIGASQAPMRLFEFDKYGFGMNIEQIWKNKKLAEPRIKIFSICKNAQRPVFFSGNAPIPWHSDSYEDTVNKFVSTRLDRLIVPVKIKSANGHGSGVLQIAEFRDRLCPPIQNNIGATEEDRAADLNFIGNVSIAI